MHKKEALILWFNQVSNEDVGSVGGKNASLGEMFQFLQSKGIRVPNGFCITALAYRLFVEKTGLKEKIVSELKNLDTGNVNQLLETGHRIRQQILRAELPLELKEAIRKAYRELGLQYGKGCGVAVRSSATAEDLPDASFAGQQESFLNVVGEEELLVAAKKCFASLFTNRAISYRVDKGFDQFKIALSIGVQKMVRSDLASSGVMFTVDTETGFENAIIVTAAPGLGESVVQGAVNPDQFIVFKPALEKGLNSIISKRKGEKKIKVVYNHGGHAYTKTVPVPDKERMAYCISDKEALQLAKWGLVIEQHYSKKAGHWKPMDMEWAKDGKTGELFIVQARPETVQSQKNRNVLQVYRLKKHGRVLVSGLSVGEKIGVGKAHVIKDVERMGEFRKGEVLITDTTDPDWEPIMKMAAAIVTNRGGRTSHAAIVSRELGIPCIVGCNTATEKVSTGVMVTVNCSEGEVGNVLEGAIPFETQSINLQQLPHTKTQVLLNLADPTQAFEHSFLPVDGVGLAREEFIVNNHIKIHPLALVQFKHLKDEKAKAEIEALTVEYEDKKAFFVDRLAEGIAMIAAAFFPRPVIVRFSDFKSNEYANLLGGKEFEPIEENPMIGWRGASRYYSEGYRKAFGLECLAIKKVREEMGLVNVKVMVPFCRTVEEGKQVLAEMKSHGLVQGKDGLEVFVMCEIPSNVILADKFAKIFDGFSIGSNDLTQLTLGLDRDSPLVAPLYDERNAAVKELIARVIEQGKRFKRKVGICGQAPSDFPDFTAFLVEHGIDSVSLNPDSVIKTKLLIAKTEEALKRK